MPYEYCSKEDVLWSNIKHRLNTETFKQKVGEIWKRNASTEQVREIG